MKKVILVVLLVPYLAPAQILDNFESGELKNWVQNVPGRWKADTLLSISGKLSLHHVFDNPETGTDRIGIKVNNLHPDEGKTSWSFIIRHGYEPSSSNNWMVFLLSGTGPETMSATETSSAYAIGVNITGSDDSLRLVKIISGNISTIISCGINWQTDIGTALAVRINIERDENGFWKVEVLRVSNELIKASSGTDGYSCNPGWFGISYKYTSTKDRLLWIDDVRIDGVFYEDTVPPGLEKCTITGINSLEISFSEEPEGILSVNNFILNGENAISIKKISELTFSVLFGSDFLNKKLNTLVINGVCDKSGNCRDNITYDFISVRAETGDVVISEIMADPVPSVSLPEKEYIEITNTTDFTFNLKGWKLLADDELYPFPQKILGPHGIMILCHKADTVFFGKYGITCGLTAFPVLNDQGKLVCLLDSTGLLIHGVEYSDGWYGNELKSEGGWSIEIIDTGYPFFDEGNWIASTSRSGGTPGIINSRAGRNPDISFEGLLNVYPEDSLHLMVMFSEPVTDSNRIPEKVKIEGGDVLKIQTVDPLLRNFMLSLSEPLNHGISYQIEISANLCDLAGNRIQNNKFPFGMPEQSVKGDILFNEILFNPLSGNSDFIEFYNASEKIVDASRLFLVSVNDTDSDTSDMKKVSAFPRCIMPSGYYAISSEEKEIEKTFPEGNSDLIFRADEMPSMPDDNGHLILYNRELDIIDEVRYSGEMHNPLLSGSEGISLEKTNPSMSSLDAVNWHSAAESSGWGTPGNVNSIFVDFPLSDEEVSFSSTRITPDTDGYEDFLSIGFRFPRTGNIITVTIFDEAGSFVRNIATNFLSGPESTLLWDGSAADGTPVRSGIYIILVTYYNDAGQRGRWKKVCTVIN